VSHEGNLSEGSQSKIRIQSRNPNHYTITFTQNPVCLYVCLSRSKLRRLIRTSLNNSTEPNILSENEVGGTCSTHSGDEKCSTFMSENLDGKVHLGDPDMDERIILKLTSTVGRSRRGWEDNIKIDEYSWETQTWMRW